MIGNVVFIGPPGGGKGTVAQIIQSVGLAHHISTGEVIRQYMKGLPESDPIHARMAAGEFLSDDETTSLLIRHLDALNSRRIIFDGYPRNVDQAMMLDRIMMRLESTVSAVYHFDIPDEIALERITGRLNCRACGNVYHRSLNPPPTQNCQCGGDLYVRADDVPDTVRHRLEKYRRETSPVLDYYDEESLVHRIDASQDIEAVVRTVLHTVT